MAKKSSEKKEPEYITIRIDAPRKYRWSTGRYIGRTYREAQENKKLVANRCVSCKEVLWPPVQVCGRCKVEAGEDWVELSQTGTVIFNVFRRSNASRILLLLETPGFPEIQSPPFTCRSEVSSGLT